MASDIETSATPAEPPVRGKLYYGWVVLWVTVFITFIAAITSQLFTGAMLPAIEEDTGWSRSSITLAVTCGSMTAGFISPIFGRWADQYGPRIITTVGIVGVVLCVYLLAFSGWLGIALFYVAYIGGRGIGQNALAGVVPRTTAVNWFKRMRGRALGFVSMAIPLGGAALVPVARFVSDKWGWEYVYFGFGSFMLVVLAPLALMTLRRRPEDMGLLPDGDSASDTATAGTTKRRAPHGGETEWTLKQAMRTPAFWLLFAAVTAGTCANGGIGFHQAAYFEDQGIAAAAAALAVSAYALSGAFANALWGFLVEHISERVIGAFTVAVAGVMCLFLLSVDTTWKAMIFAVLFGMSARGETSIIVMIQAQYFGRNSFGAISGFSTPFQQISLGLGPSIAALIYDLAGASYTIAFVLFGCLYFASALFIWFARKPAPTAEVLAMQPVP
jgi:sugar phosphate permease